MDHIVHESVLGHVTNGVLRNHRFADTRLAQNQNRNASVGIGLDEKVLNGYGFVAYDQGVLVSFRKIISVHVNEINLNYTSLVGRIFGMDSFQGIQDPLVVSIL